MRLFSNHLHSLHWRRHLSSQSIRSFKQGEIILLSDIVPKHLYLIKTGYVRVYDITSDGDEKPVAFDAKGEIFPIAWVFGGIERTTYFYQALVDCELYEFTRKDFLEYLRLHPKVGTELYASMARRFASLQTRIYALGQSRATQKVLYTLLYLIDRFGKTTGQTVRLEIPLTQQELANFMGLTRETTNAELIALEKQKVLKRNGQFYTINRARFDKLLD